VIDAAAGSSPVTAESPLSSAVPTRRATVRGMPPVSHRPSLSSVAEPPPTLEDPDDAPPASMSEALKDVILDQIARDDDGGSPPRTVKLTSDDGKPGKVPKARASAARKPATKADLDFGLEDIEQSFDQLLSDPAASASEPTSGDIAEVQALFRQIASSYLGPVRDFMVELGIGSPSKDWLAVCTPAVQSLQKSATSMGLTELSRALERLATAFDEVERLPGPVIGDVARHVIENAHHDLARLLPEAFAVAEERDRREPIIVQTLLRQVPDVRKVALDKIYAAGLTRLEMFYVARAEDLAQAAGLSVEQARSIIDRFQAFKNESGSKPATDGRPREQMLLGELTTRLGRQTAEFERAQSGARGLDKKALRKQRNDTLLEIQLVLARLGRVDLVGELEKLPFTKKVDALVGYLAELKRAASSGG
jgi:hypothetical protein